MREENISVILISQGSSEHSICCAIPQEQAERAAAVVRHAFERELKEGQIQSVDIDPDLAILAAVGDGMAGTPGISGKVFVALGTANVNVRAIAQGASERNISVVIEGRHATRALRAVHAGLYLSPHTISIGLIGPGTVGRVMLEQIASQSARLREQFNVDLRIRGLLGSKRMLLSDSGVDLAHWRSQYEASQVAADLKSFVQHVRVDYLPHTVLVDCTASAEVASHYPEWLEAGIHIVTPNKKANSADLAFYRRLREARRKGSSHYLYEATVGAGLPVVQTLRDLRETGDDVSSVEGIFSGTLAYLFNVYDGNTPFSDIVRDARQRGYTEPDPRDDLSGMDVARKLIILGREMGLSLEMSDVKVESLVPAGLESGSIEHFMSRLPRHDAAMRERFDKARGARQSVALRREGDCPGSRDGRCGRARCETCVRQHRPHGQCGALRDPTILRQSADRAGAGRRSRGHRGRCVRRPVAGSVLPGGALVTMDFSSRALGDFSVPRLFAPASVGNVAIGFDILGMAVDALGDRVTVSRRAAPGVTITAISGVPEELPLEAERNTAGRALLAMQEALQPGFGFDMQIQKGIPLGSGLGGSAASAVGAVVAANALLPEPVSKLDLLKFAMQGEKVASGSLHVDNIAPCLFGGLVLTVGIDHPRVKQIPVPAGIKSVIVHPHMFLSTKQARAILKRTVELSDFVWQTANLAGFISGCYTNDLDLIRASFQDVVIEPQRQALIPGFNDVRHAAMEAGALGCSISGAGPTMFAWALAGHAETVLETMRREFGAALDRTG